MTVARADGPPTDLRPAVSIGAWNLVSRLTGFVRVLAVGAALGATYLGNTYQSANLVSNILFELLAAGVLSSVLVPTFVAHLSSAGKDDTARVAGAVLGVLLALLAPVVVVGMLAAEPVMRLLTVAVHDEAIRREEVRLGAFFLLFFLPQVLLYGVGTVSTGVLHASNRFVAVAAAPVLNNLVVTATMAAYWAARTGPPALHLPAAWKVVLAAGTTLGVAAMSAVPLAAAWRAGLRIRPRWAPREPELRLMARRGAWAAAYLGLTQLLLAVTLVLANRVEGGVVAYQIAFTFFLLPYALVGNPILTTLFPRLSADAHRGAWDDYARRLGSGVRTLVFLVLPASALLAAVAAPAVRALAVGALRAGDQLVGRTLAAYAVGLVGYAAFQLLTRASYAAGDTRTPTLVNLGVAGVGCALMASWSAAATGGDRVVVLGLAHSAVQVGGALALLAVLARRLPRGALALRASLARTGAASALAGAVAWAVVHVLPTGGRAGAAAATAAAGLAGAAVYLAVQRGLGAPELEGWRRRGVTA